MIASPATQFAAAGGGGRIEARFDHAKRGANKRQIFRPVAHKTASDGRTTNYELSTPSRRRVLQRNTRTSTYVLVLSERIRRRRRDSQVGAWFRDQYGAPHRVASSLQPPLTALSLPPARPLRLAHPRYHHPAPILCYTFLSP